MKKSLNHSERNFNFEKKSFETTVQTWKKDIYTKKLNLKNQKATLEKSKLTWNQDIIQKEKSLSNLEIDLTTNRTELSKEEMKFQQKLKMALENQQMSLNDIIKEKSKKLKLHEQISISSKKAQDRLELIYEVEFKKYYERMLIATALKRAELKKNKAKLELKSSILLKKPEKNKFVIEKLDAGVRDKYLKLVGHDQED